MTHPGNHIGTLIKSHGYKGELLLKASALFLEKLIPGIPLFIEISEQRIPFFIEEISSSDSAEKCIIKFEFIDSDKQARQYLSARVYLEIQSDKEAVTMTDPEDLTGFLVIDTVSGTEMIVTDYYDDAANPLLVLDHAGEELLLPAKADYIVSVDQGTRTIKVDFPEGLME